ncbi:MAG: rRNA maturation RNase YbeY [Elusimicrobiota bacterium]
MSFPSLNFIKKTISIIFKIEKKKLTGDLNIIFVDKKNIKKINMEFLNEKNSTDVIAFPYEIQKNITDQVFGDIYICVQEATLNAKEYSQSIKKELVRLIVHGTLHLLGYDDHKKKDYEKMWARQELIVSKLFNNKK